MRPIFLILMMSLVLTSCEEEVDPAKELHDRATAYAENREFDQAIKILQNIRINYEDSDYAVRAENEIPQYEELVAIAMSNEKRQIQQKFGRIHMALENYKARFLAYPLMPKDLEKLPRLVVPEWADIWGHQIHYSPTYSRPDIPKHLPDGYALASFGEDGLPGGDGSEKDYYFKNGLDVMQVTE